MAGEDRMIMSVKELRRAHLIHQVLEGKLRQGQAAEVMGLSDRQVRRIVRRVRREGDRGLVHRSRGRPSNRAMAGKVKARVMAVYGARYADFGPTLAAEKLAERDETLRLWLLEAGITHFKRRKRPHRQWRERKKHRGQMVQMDGSHHAWLEDRGPVCVLMGYMDDATSRVYARFYEYEGTMPAMDSFKRYIRQYGIPLSVYSDKHTTYRSPAEPTIAEQLEGRKPMSQFERALGELGVELIPAHSPQAKGRIERLFKTFQDRLIKEMRLGGIKTMEAANRFLAGYLPIYNRRLSVKAAEAADLHRPVASLRELEGILCVKTGRVLRNDFTVAYNGKLYQIEDSLRAHKVTIKERLDGSMMGIFYQGRRLRYREISARPVKTVEPPKSLIIIKRATKPSPHHPWKQMGYFQNEKRPQDPVT